MRQPAGPKDHHSEIVRKRLHRLLDGAAEHEAAMPGWRRIHHHVDREWNHRARPVRILVDFAEQQVHRHGHAVIDVHLVADGEIEFVEDDGLRDMRGKRRMTLDHRHRPRSPAFVGWRKFRGAAEREGRDHLHRERRGVIVVDDDGDVGLGFAHPLLRSLETRENPFPIRLLGLVVVDRRADGGHMRRTYSCDDPGHGVTSVLLIWIWSWSTWLWLSPWAWHRPPSSPPPREISTARSCRYASDCLRPIGRRRASCWRNPVASSQSSVRRDAGTNGRRWRRAWR